MIENYIKAHKVSTNNICLFRDWEGFLRLLFEYNGCIEMIVWYDYCKISEQNKSIGSGGYIDIQNREYMWAETPIYKTDLQGKTFDELYAYISKVRKQYADYNLYPEFYIK